MVKWVSGKAGCLVVICSPRMESCLVRSSRVVSPGCEMEGTGSHWVLWRVEVLQGPVQLKRAGLCCCLALAAADPIWLCHMICPAPILQGRLIAGAKCGESSTEILSFCLKQAKPQAKPQTKPPYIAALLLPSFIAAFVFWIDYLWWMWQAGCFCWKGFCLGCDLVFTSKWTVSSCPWAALVCGSWPKGLVIWGCSSGRGQGPLQHRSIH